MERLLRLRSAYASHCRAAVGPRRWAGALFAGNQAPTRAGSASAGSLGGASAAAAPGAGVAVAATAVDPAGSLITRWRTTPSVIRSVCSSAAISARWAAELQEVVLGLFAVVDLVGERPRAPGLVADQLTLRRDRRASVGDDLRAHTVLGAEVEQQDEIVDRLGSGHQGRG